MKLLQISVHQLAITKQVLNILIFLGFSSMFIFFIVGLHYALQLRDSSRRDWWMEHTGEWIKNLLFLSLILSFVRIFISLV